MSCFSRRLTHTLGAVSLLTACATVGTEPLPEGPSHHVQGGFRNTNPDFRRPEGWARAKFWLSRAWASTVGSRTFEAPRVANDGTTLRDGFAGPGHPKPTVTWVGHSTLLVQLEGVTLLTDPHWGERASPLSWAGPRRLSPPGLAFAALPPIHLVLISHDHFDHLDVGTVKQLAATHDPLFVVPLGLKRWLADQSITHVEELDWWESLEFRGLRVVCTPAQHFSQRTPGDSNTRLWASWAVIGASPLSQQPQKTPIVRKNMLLAVATPRCLQATLVWTASINVVLAVPNPRRIGTARRHRSGRLHRTSGA